MSTAQPHEQPREPILEGRRVRLRPWTEGDLGVLYLACQDPDIQRWTTVPSPYRHADARAFLDDIIPRARTLGGAAFGVEVPGAGGTARLVASIALLHAADDVGEIGYWAAPWARGHGYVGEALGVLVGWCFGPRGLARLEMLVEPGNHRSRAVAERAGFAAEGTLRRRLPLRGERRDLVMYALLADDVGARV